MNKGSSAGTRGNEGTMGHEECTKTLSPVRAAAMAFALIAVIALGLVGCAPQANEGSQGSGEAGSGSGSESESGSAAVQVDFNWSETSDCSMCHAKEEASFQDSTCGAFQHADVTCAECHTDASALASAHAGATAEKAARAALKATAVDQATCESCHAMDEVAAATAGVTLLTDTNGTVVNPHELSESPDHEQITCTSCHQEHVSGANIEKKAQRACANCHHADVYECYTCHS